MAKSSIFSKTVVIGIVLLCFNTVSLAQNEGTFKAKKNSFKISPTAFFASTFALSYERYIAESLSLQITGGYMAASKKSYDSNSGYYNGGTYVSASSNAKNTASGGLVDLSLRYFFLKGQSVMSGLYAGPYGRYSKNSFEINTFTTSGISAPVTYKYNIESYEGGALFGWQLVAKNAFVLDMYVGGGLKVSNNTAPASYYNNTNSNNNSNTNSNKSFWILESQDYTGITPKAGFRIGFVL